jgi:hypothetical protein
MQEMFCCPSIDTLYASLLEPIFVFITHPKSDLLHLLHLRHPEGCEAGRRKPLDPVVLVMQPKGREQSVDELL